MSEEAGNMELWEKVKVTDPAFTKDFSTGKYSGTTVDPQWQLQRATEIWGPFGGKWGLRKCEWRVLELERPVMMLTCELFYPTTEGVGVIPQAVELPLGHRDEICKKLLTNARSKALSTLGFSADIYLGKFEDDQYVRDAETAFAQSEDFANRALAAIAVATSAAGLDSCWKRAASMFADGTIDDLQLRRLQEACSVRRGQLGISEDEETETAFD